MASIEAVLNGSGPFFSIDVECVATGNDHNSRAVASVAVVNEAEQVVANIFVLPDKPVTSYLTELTGITAELLTAQGVSLEAAVKHVKAVLPPWGVVVGHTVRQDIGWLGLVEGRDFASLLDISGMYRIWNSGRNTWSMFSQDHLANTLLGWDVHNQKHSAAGDAVKSMQLFKLYRHYLRNPHDWEQAQHVLLSVQPPPSFAKRFPVYEGVCMGNRRQCSCGAPFLSC